MAKSNTERQQAFKARHGDKVKRLDILLPIVEAELLANKAKEAGLSKTEYITKLLHGNVSGNENNPLDRVLNELMGLGCSIEKAIDELKMLPGNVTDNDNSKPLPCDVTGNETSQKPVKPKTDSAVSNKVLSGNVTGNETPPKSVEQNPDSTANNTALPDDVTRNGEYDGTSPLGEAISGLLGCSLNKAGEAIEKARHEIKKGTKSKVEKLPVSMKLRIYKRIKKMTSPTNNG